MELTKINKQKVNININAVTYTQSEFLTFLSGEVLQVSDIENVEFDRFAKYKNGLINLDNVETYSFAGQKCEVRFLNGFVLSCEGFEVTPTKTTRKRTPKK